MFTEVPGKPNIVCFKNMTEFVVNDKWFSEGEKKYSNDEAERIIVTAAMLTNKHVTLQHNKGTILKIFFQFWWQKE